MAEVLEKTVIMDNIPFTLKEEKIIGSMHMHGPGQRFADNLRELIEIVTPLARPKAMYKIACVANKEPDSIEIDGVKFAGRLIRLNLDQVNTVFPYVATCGQEVEAIEVPARDILKRHCLEAIKLNLVITATVYLQKHLNQHYAAGELSNMSPGEIDSWPVAQQKELFAVLGDVEGRIGVKLTSGGLMSPIKSRSGLHYTNDVKFISCYICTQKKCPGRQAAYDPVLAAKYQ
jgi:hypothetical protein